jgi:phosphopantothenoylcysteine synthetase/decarboxylase
LVTAGPTFEKIDPVRFIGNFHPEKWDMPLLNNLPTMALMSFWFQALLL